MQHKLERYLKNGITTVFDAGSTYNLLEQSDSLQGQLSLPKVFMSGPLLTTYQPQINKDLGKDGT